MQRIRVLSLFKKILRTGRNWEAKIPEKTTEERTYIREEAFSKFKENKEVNDPEKIKNLIEEAEKRLEIGIHYRLPYERPVYLHPGASYGMNEF